MKRLISADTSGILGFTPAELMQSIRASEGRVVLLENITALIPQVTDITNAEIARAFGADLILLNFLDVDHPYIHGLDETGDPVRRLRELVGRPVGINLEPVDTAAAMHEERQDVAPGRRALRESIVRAGELGADFLCLPGNPGSGVRNAQITETVRLCRELFDGLVIAGKMHGAGAAESVVDRQAVEDHHRHQPGDLGSRHHPPHRPRQQDRRRRDPAHRRRRARRVGGPDEHLYAQ